ncbi:MAG: biotin--[Clostridia bacterium]|nr:biotin--[acetyl-CoA-carboxylase] ligase [Clostridia bacterium]
MSKVKEKLLILLESRRGSFVSGQDIADDFGVSRTAVSKAADQLRADGYSIESRQNLGYRLSEDNDIINDCNLRPALKYNPDRALCIYREIDSTNTALKRMAQEGAADRTVVIAESQTAGRGRQGKSFFSPAGSGLYMSLLVRPEDGLPFDCVTMLTVLAGVAAAEAVRVLFDIDARIKWVNDIYCNGKKLCGILTEATLDAEMRSVSSAVIGIGINVRRTAFPPELADIACAVEDFSDESDVKKSALAAEILNRIDGYLNELCSSDGKHRLISKYRTLSCVIGEEITFMREGVLHNARAIGIDEDGALIIQYDNSTREALNSGEISIRVGQS